MEIPSSATARINQTLTWLASIAKVSGFSDRVMVRVLDYFPAYGILAIDPDTETGYISVRLNAYQIPNERCPRFELDATKNAKWFRFFANQAELLWAEAESINLSQYSEKTDIGEKMRGPTGKAE
jgi:hypothetical protein